MLISNNAWLEDWVIVGDRAYGIVYGHHRIPDGKRISTSVIRKRYANGRKIRTLNTIYNLGKPAKSAS
jgi:hypothetical protein